MEKPPTIELTVEELLKQSDNPSHIKAVDGLPDHAKVYVYKSDLKAKKKEAK
jgi:hypothetical protein